MTRTPLLLAALSAGALALGACGSSGDSGGTSGGGSSRANKQDAAFDGAVKFSKCMRAHGLDWPDPERSSNGLIKMFGPKNLNPNDPKVKAAQNACQKYMQKGGGEAMSPAQRAKAQDALVNYAGCMRSHGVPMKDPKPGGGGGILIQKGQGGPSPDSPAFKAADKQCHHFLAEIENGAQREESP